MRCKKRKTVYGKNFRKPFSKTRVELFDHFTSRSLFSLSALCSLLSALCRPEPPPATPPGTPSHACRSLLYFSLSAQEESRTGNRWAEPPRCTDPTAAPIAPSHQPPHRSHRSRTIAPSHPLLPAPICFSHDKPPPTPIDLIRWLIWSNQDLSMGFNFVDWLVLGFYGEDYVCCYIDYACISQLFCNWNLSWVATG